MDLNLKEIYNDYLTEIELKNKEVYKKKNPNKYYRASAAGHCFKKHWYSINKAEGKEIDERTKRLFRLGTIVHDDIQKAIELYQSNNMPSKNEEVLSQEYNLKFQVEYPILIESLKVMGSADIVILDSENTASVIDIKTMGWRAWSKRVTKNKSINKYNKRKIINGSIETENKPSRMYELQLGTYALGILEQENIKYDDISLYLVYYKKDDSIMKSVNVNAVWMDNATEYWVSLNETLDMVKDEDELPRGSSNVPMEDWECRYCQFEPICN